MNVAIGRRVFGRYFHFSVLVLSCLICIENTAKALMVFTAEIGALYWSDKL